MLLSRCSVVSWTQGNRQLRGDVNRSEIFEVERIEQPKFTARESKACAAKKRATMTHKLPTLQPTESLRFIAMHGHTVCSDYLHVVALYPSHSSRGRPAFG